MSDEADTRGLDATATALSLQERARFPSALRLCLRGEDPQEVADRMTEGPAARADAAWLLEEMVGRARERRDEL